jgi:hypothetical protein
MGLDWIALGKQVIAAGAPTIGAALGGPLGAQIGGVLGTVLGVDPTPEAIGAVVIDDPDRLARAEVEPSADLTQWLLVHARVAASLAESEAKRESWFSWAWRPALSWLLIVMWAWNGLVLPIVNAIGRLGIAVMPYDQLLAFSGIWLAIYGGGHTIKAIYDGSKGRG